LPPAEIERLETFAAWTWFESEGGGIYATEEDPEKSSALAERLGDVDALIVCHGAPRLDAALMDEAPRLKFVGELEGDRFAVRIDLEAAWARGVRVVDTTNGSSYPVAEWALGLILVSLRQAGGHFRRIIAGQTGSAPKLMDKMGGSLMGKRVGLIGCGHMGRRLIKLLKPFEGEIWVHDPYLPREMAEVVGFVQTSLDNVLSQCDVVVCVAPLTPATEGMLGARELGLLRPGSVFVNVTRGKIVDSQALIARLKKGDIAAGIEAFDPEPFPPDSEILALENAFLSPHFGWYSGDEYPQFFQLMVDELDRFFQGHETWFDLTPRSMANRTGE
jgi:phosphoglycerate dehydrogenase-like enzyme